LAAKAFGFNYVDTGAMYRAVTWKAIEEGVNVDDNAAVIAMMQRIKVEFELAHGAVRMLVDGVDPGNAVREPRVAEKVSTIAAIPEVRQILVQHQRSLTRFGSLVMEGRDIGTVVFPDAPLKIFLDASPAERARRRAAELLARGEHVDIAAMEREIAERDARDRSRAHSPLIAAPDARVVDSTARPADAIVDDLCALAQGLERA